MKKQIFETSNGTFSTTGNGTFDHGGHIIIRKGWKPTGLGAKKQKAISTALMHPDVDKVFRRGSKIFKLMLNGNTEEV